MGDNSWLWIRGSALRGEVNDCLLVSYKLDSKVLGADSFWAHPFAFALRGIGSIPAAVYGGRKGGCDGTGWGAPIMAHLSEMVVSEDN
ncbi:uncharacterized protein G2W53_033852 [Senna tora]|uniref:Uncharacterized protein n=1 Tax=Senna tora TaxID=362788 RepID=A0A834T0B8_9FABA|nr:uncharacterized protein G2W53_033852 [Senna tora]